MINARSEDDVEENVIIEKVKASSGVHSDITITEHIKCPTPPSFLETCIYKYR